MIEVISENKEEDELFSGSISFYTLNCREIASNSYEEGEYISSLNSTSFFTKRLKSASYEKGDCSTSCLINFLDEIFTIMVFILLFALLLVLHMQKVLVYLFAYFALATRNYTVWKNVVKFYDTPTTNKTEIF